VPSRPLVIAGLPLVAQAGGRSAGRSPRRLCRGPAHLPAASTA